MTSIANSTTSDVKPQKPRISIQHTEMNRNRRNPMKTNRNHIFYPIQN
jgi:hypothetical protein